MTKARSLNLNRTRADLTAHPTSTAPPVPLGGRSPQRPRKLPAALESSTASSAPLAQTQPPAVHVRRQPCSRPEWAPLTRAALPRQVDLQPMGQHAKASSTEVSACWMSGAGLRASPSPESRSKEAPALFNPTRRGYPTASDASWVQREADPSSTAPLSCPIRPASTGGVLRRTAILTASRGAHARSGATARPHSHVEHLLYADRLHTHPFQGVLDRRHPHAQRRSRVVPVRRAEGGRQAGVVR